MDIKISFLKLDIARPGKLAMGNIDVNAVNKKVKLVEKRFHIDRILLGGNDTNRESESHIRRVLPLRDNLKQKTCSVCSKTVLATNFCPECGARF